MNLAVTTPFGVLLERRAVRSVRAEDASGWFGIRPGHVPLVTALRVSVLSYREADGAERYVAVRGGVLLVDARGDVRVATPEGVVGDDLAALERDVIAGLAARAAAGDAQRLAARRLERAMLHTVEQLVRPRRGAPRLGATEADDG